MIFKCYSSEKLITLNILHEVIPTAESTEAMRIKCLAQGNNILLPGFYRIPLYPKLTFYPTDQYALLALHYFSAPFLPSSATVLTEFSLVNPFFCACYFNIWCFSQNIVIILFRCVSMPPNTTSFFQLIYCFS